LKASAFIVFDGRKNGTVEGKKSDATSTPTTRNDPVPITILAKPDLPTATFAQTPWPI